MVNGDSLTTSDTGGSRSLVRPEQTWFSTESVPPSRRVSDWETHHAAALVGLRTRLGKGSRLSARTSTLHLPRLRIAKVNASPHSVRRTAEDIALHPVSGVIVYLPLQGVNNFAHRNGSITIGPGRGLVCDGDTIFSRDFAHGVSELVIQLPRETLAQLTDAKSVRRAVPLNFEDNDQLHNATRDFIRLADGALDRGVRQGGKLETRLLGLLTRALEEPMADRSHLQEALDEIAESHADPGLSATSLAQLIGVSERQLSRLFSASGQSIPQTVLDTRLASARRMLADPAWAEAPMAEIASSSGFGSQSQFSRSYRARFGSSPLRHRKQLLEKQGRNELWVPR